jgi:hypothetical protein
MLKSKSINTETPVEDFDMYNFNTPNRRNRKSVAMENRSLQYNIQRDGNQSVQFISQVRKTSE